MIAALVTVGLAVLLLVWQFASMVKVASAREITQACVGIRPAEKNAAFGALPTSQPVDFTAQNHEGKMVSLSDYRGKIVFVNFWATWCGVCDSEKRGLEEMAAEMRSDDFVVLTVASEQSWDTVSKYMKEKFPRGTSFDVLLDKPASPDDNLGPITRSFGISAVPETFVIDREGRVRYYFANRRDWHSDVAMTCLRGMIDG